MGCDIHMFMERRGSGRWVAVNAPPHEGPMDYQKDYPWGAWTDPENPVSELTQAVLPITERVPSKAQEWAFGRKYDAFGRLANVRRDNMYREPNGIPADVSDHVRAEWGEDEDSQADWHTPAHWTLEDLRHAHLEAVTDGEVYGADRIDDLLVEMARVAEEYDLPPDSVRVVFWFDN